MKLTRHYTDATESERLDAELRDEVTEISKWMKKYFNNVDSLLGKKRSNEVRKHMINTLVEQL